MKFQGVKVNQSLIKVSDIITYIMKIMGFGLKTNRSSSFRDIQKSAECQDLESRLVFKIARTKIHQTFQASKYDV